MRWTGHAARMGDEKLRSEKLKGRDHSEDLGIDGCLLKHIK